MANTDIVNQLIIFKICNKCIPYAYTRVKFRTGKISFRLQLPSQLRKIWRKGFVVNPLTLCTSGCVAGRKVL